MTNDEQFPGKVALVTGGGSGIGRAAAIELGRQGASVAVLSRKQDRIDEATHPRNLDGIRWPVEFPQGTSPLAGGPADPAQVGRVIAFLLSDAADHVSGTEMWADAAESLLVG